MAMKPASLLDLQAAVNAVAECDGNQTSAAKLLGVPRPTLLSRMENAKRQGITIGKMVSDPNNPEHLRHKLKKVEQELRAARENQLDTEDVRRKIVGLTKDANLSEVPNWAVKGAKSKSSPGVPMLFASDWHFGEIVDPSQIGGVNSYNLTIGKQRARTLITKTIDLLNNHMVNPEYPGIVFALGGDLVSGDIHEELLATNETEIMPVVVELFGVLSWCIQTLAESFGKVFVPAVSGNHGRNTHKIRAKGRNYTSFDWLLYTFLAKRFENDSRVTFLIPNGPDALFSVCGRKYLLTHGDSYRGGDGLIGCLGPITRGDTKKRSRNAQIDQEYDVQLLGHFHQMILLERFIVNGSLVGYNEYANANNFGFEPPRQALWVNHPAHGRTFSMPVNVGEEKATKRQTEWVSWSQ